MPRFYCKNEGCANYGKEIFIQKLTYKFDKESGELKSSVDLICEACKEPLIQKKTEGYPQVLKFDSLSDEDKKRIIHKRAQDHFNKVGREQKEHIKKQVIKKYMGG